jgi:hypothetical protein
MSALAFAAVLAPAGIAIFALGAGARAWRDSRRSAGPGDEPQAPAALAGPPDAGEMTLADLRRLAGNAQALVDKMKTVTSGHVIPDEDLRALDSLAATFRARSPEFLAGARTLADAYRTALPDVPDAVMGRICWITFLCINYAVSLAPAAEAGAITRNLLAATAVELTESTRLQGLADS